MATRRAKLEGMLVPSGAAIAKRTRFRGAPPRYRLIANGAVMAAPAAAPASALMAMRRVIGAGLTEAASSCAGPANRSSSSIPASPMSRSRLLAAEVRKI
jgi:hypothetical protein